MLLISPGHCRVPSASCEINQITLCFYVKHPSIMGVDHIEFLDNGAVVVRQFYPGQVLRDIITRANPKNGYLKKYCQPKKRKTFQLNEIKMITFQLLEALQFLHDKGVAHG